MGKCGKLRVYPNPTNGMINVTGIRHCGLDPQSPANNDDIADQVRNDIKGIEIFDVFGRTVGAYPCGRPEKTETTFDLSNVPAGIYFVRITTENNVITKKIIIQ